MKLKDAVITYSRYLKKKEFSESHITSVNGRLNRFVKTMAEDAEIAAVQKTDISRHFSAMKQSGLADGTLAGHKSTNRAFWKYAKKKGWVKKNPSKILVGNKRHRYSFKPVHSQAAHEADLISVLIALPAFASHRNYAPRDVRDALIVALVADSAGRRGDIWAISCRVAVRALNKPRRMKNGETVYTIVLQGDDSKTGESKIRFFQKTADLLQMWLTLMPLNATHICCNLRTGKKLARENVSLSFIRACKFANVPVFRPQSVRKRVVTDIISKSGDQKAGQLIANHKSARTTQEYYNLLQDEKVDTIASSLANGRLKKHDDIDKLATAFFRAR